MALTVKGTDLLAARLEATGDAAVPVSKMAVYDAAGVIAESIKTSLRANVSDNSMGDLEDSLGIAQIRTDLRVTNTRIGFGRGTKEYDRNGHPNLLKARALNSGTSRGQPATGFFRKGFAASKANAQKAMADTFEKEMAKRQNKAK